MPRKKQSVIHRELKPDELIETLVGDPAAPPDLIVLAGLLRKSSRDGNVRLYLTPSLNDFVEVQEGDVIASRSLGSPFNPIGGTILWIRRDAKLIHTCSRTSVQGRTEFLMGPLINNFLPRTIPGGFVSSAARRGLWGSCSRTSTYDPDALAVDCTPTFACATEQWYCTYIYGNCYP